MGYTASEFMLTECSIVKYIKGSIWGLFMTFRKIRMKELHKTMIPQ
jgi:hypothetical protein